MQKSSIVLAVLIIIIFLWQIAEVYENYIDEGYDNDGHY